MPHAKLMSSEPGGPGVLRVDTGACCAFQVAAESRLKIKREGAFPERRFFSSEQ